LATGAAALAIVALTLAICFTPSEATIKL
jgi:hypothetical protein